MVILGNGGLPAGDVCVGAVRLFSAFFAPGAFTHAIFMYLGRKNNVNILSCIQHCFGAICWNRPYVNFSRYSSSYVPGPYHGLAR